MKRNILLGVSATILLVVGVISYWSPWRQPAACGFIPALRSTAKPLTLYCADERKLPAGVISHTASATYGNGVVLYTLQDGTDTLSVSLQTKPVKDKLANFVPNVIPLSITIDTPVGKASMGISNGHTIISLPTQSNTWVLITAPANYSANAATRLLGTFTAAD